MQEIDYRLYLPQVAERLGGTGVFLNSLGDKPNTMTISWGSIGVYWGYPIFVVPVRPSRFSHDLIARRGEFTVSVPLDATLNKALAFCGAKSGRDIDKFSELGLSPTAIEGSSVPVIKECQVHFVCKVIYTQELDITQLPDNIIHSSYPKGDGHTLFYGQILACYIDN